MPLLRIADIHKSFGPTEALSGAGLELWLGEVHALVGENGAGKTTLMNILAGAFPADRGTMHFQERLFAPSSPRESRAAGIALIHQELSLFPHLSVMENILVGMETARMGWIDWEACRRRALEVLQTFDHPEIQPETLISMLPISFRQVVEICRAVAAKAQILLMDEPTSCLQAADAERLFLLIRRLTQQGLSVIYISHFLDEVRRVATRYTVLRDGRTVAGGSLDAASNDELVRHMVGRQVDQLFPHRRPSVKPGPPLLEVRDLASPPGLEAASFRLQAGEILGIAGLMGSGRTEMVRALFGLDDPAAGTVILRGVLMPARGGRPSMRLVQGIGYLSEDRKGEGLALPLSLADNITMTRPSSCSRGGWLSLKRQQDQAWRLATKLSIKAHSPLQPASTLSGGNQQKVVLARLLHQDAEVLLLDEPTRGIDIGSKAQIYDAIAGCAAQGKGILMISSYLPELFGLCDRLAVMSRGRLSTARPIGDWTPEGAMEAAIGNQDM